jgi:hypothetical protein
MYLHILNREQTLFRLATKFLILFGFLMTSASAHAEAIQSKAAIKALKVCSKTYFSCQTACREEQDAKAILACINTQCAKEYDVCRATAIRKR